MDFFRSDGFFLGQMGCLSGQIDHLLGQMDRVFIGSCGYGLFIGSDGLFIRSDR